MIQFISASFKGQDKEKSESGKTVVTINPFDPTQMVGI
jgi:hypothetical protein